MYLPTIPRHPAVRKLDSEISEIERQIGMWDTVAHVALESTTDTGLASIVAKIQLDTLTEFLESRGSDLTLLRERLHSRLQSKREEIEANYITFLDGKNTFFEQGKEIELSPEKRLELASTFNKNLQEKIRRIASELIIEDESLLESSAQLLEEKYSLRRQVVVHLLEDTQRFAKKSKQLEPILNELLQRRDSLLRDGAIEDLFAASALGSEDYVRHELDKEQQKPSLIVSLVRLISSTQPIPLVTARDPLGFTALHIASYFNHYFIIKFLLSRGADPAAKAKRDSDDSGYNGYQPLHFAAKAGASTAVIQLLEGGAPVDGRGEYGRTPLHIAAFNGHDICTAALLASGANPNLKTSDRDNAKTPLHDAVIHANRIIVRTLLNDERRDLKTDVKKKDIDGHTPLYHAVRDGLPEIMTMIYQHHSWQPCLDSADPNSLQKLYAMRPKFQKNSKKVLEILSSLLSKFTKAD